MKILPISLCILLCVGISQGQRAEVTINLNEQFFDALLEAIFVNAGSPEFPLARVEAGESRAVAQSRAEGFVPVKHLYAAPSCGETIKLMRENAGVRTAVRFRDGKIYAPLAFSGTYNPPLIGCVQFSGFAETSIELEFDRAGQRLIGRATVFNVSLDGSGGIGGDIIAKLVQNSIDRRVNPIEIVRTDKISFSFPIPNSHSLRMNAVSMRHEVVNGALNIRILYQFSK